MKIPNTLLRSGKDIKLGPHIKVHQPTYGEIAEAQLSEEEFLQACEMICITKDKLGIGEDAEMPLLKSNFGLLLALLLNKEFPTENREAIMRSLSLLLPQGEIKLNISGIMIKVNEETLYTIDEELFNDFQSIVRMVSGLQLLRGDEDIEYNAESEAAKKIKEKLLAGRRKAAQLKAEEAEKSGSSLLGNYLDILVVGCGYSYEQLNHYTIPQIFLAVEKYQAYYTYELDFRCRMVGGGDKNSAPDNWMLEQKKNNS